MRQSKYTLVKNAKLLCEGRRTSNVADILVRNGDNAVIERIAQFIDPSEFSGDECVIYNAKSRLVLPGFIDMHVHLRDPGFEYKEDIASGTAAAAAGGYAAVVAMPNTRPVCDTPEVLAYVAERAAKVGSCRVFQTAAITRGQRGEELVDFDALAAAGAVAFTDDGRPVTDSGLMYEAMKYCAKRDYLIISHSEDLSLANGGAVNEGRVSELLHVRGIPNAAEDIMIARELILAEKSGCRLHIAHVSTRGGLDMIRQAKKRGVRVTCETCPHYFALCEDDVVFYGTNAKMNPPLRSRDDVAAVIEAIVDGTIDCISTDHAPHTDAEKSVPLSEAPNGIIGLQTAFSAGVTYLVLPGHITLSRLVELMTVAPAAILSAKELTGRIEEGGRADFCVVNTDVDYILTANMLRGKSANTPFLGLTLRGMVEKTFFNGGK